MFPVISGRKIRVALVGCGRISANHFAAFDAYPDELELGAVCDVDAAKAGNVAAQRGGVAVFTDYETMLRDSGCDLVAVCSPSGLHPEQTIMAARRGYHVVTEKPMGTKWSDGISMVKECDKANVRLFVVKQNRYNATVQLLKRALVEKRFGQVYMVVVNVFWTRPQAYYDSAAWRGTWEMDGGAFMNQASHYVDLLEWLFGPIADVQAMTATLVRDIEVEDTGVLNVRWRKGTLGSMNVTMLTYPKNMEGSVTVLGEKGTVRLGGVALNEIQRWEFADTRDYDAQVMAANYAVDSVYGRGHTRYYRNVIDVLRGEAAPETDGREGLKALEVLIAAYHSARDGKTVSLPLGY